MQSTWSNFICALCIGCLSKQGILLSDLCTLKSEPYIFWCWSLMYYAKKDMQYVIKFAGFSLLTYCRLFSGPSFCITSIFASCTFTSAPSHRMQELLLDCCAGSFYLRKEWRNFLVIPLMIINDQQQRPSAKRLLFLYIYKCLCLWLYTTHIQSHMNTLHHHDPSLRSWCHSLPKQTI